MRSAAEWICGRQAHGGVYLWVMEANAPARRFYERLGAGNAGRVDLEDPGGGRAPIVATCGQTLSPYLPPRPP